MTTSAAVVPLEWDTQFFGFPVARVVCSHPQPGALAAAARACREERVRCAYLLLDAGDTTSIEAALAAGFVPRDVRLELDRPLPRRRARPDEGSASVGRARPEQHAALEAISRDAFVQSRFFTDPGFPRERCRELYVAFLRRGLAGAPERTTLATAEGDGFVVCHLDPVRRVGTIELIAVGEHARGRGTGAALLAAADTTFAAAGLSAVEVATQAANVASQRLYQRAGFLTRRAGLWLHGWFG